MVSELINSASKTWNVQKLYDHFVGPDVDVIKNIPLSSRIQEDHWSWHYDKRGVFSVLQDDYWHPGATGGVVGAANRTLQSRGGQEILDVPVED